jgi:hypothetical protein
MQSASINRPSPSANSNLHKRHHKHMNCHNSKESPKKKRTTPPGQPARSARHLIQFPHPHPPLALRTNAGRLRNRRRLRPKPISHAHFCHQMLSLPESSPIDGLVHSSLQQEHSASSNPLLTSVGQPSPFPLRCSPESLAFYHMSLFACSCPFCSPWSRTQSAFGGVRIGGLCWRGQMKRRL